MKIRPVNLGHWCKIASILSIFLFPYLYLSQYVGRFPAEDISRALPNKCFKSALCLPEAEPSGISPAAAPPVLSLKEGLSRGQKKAAEKSFSIYYSDQKGLVFALDQIDDKTVGVLSQWRDRSLISNADLNRFIDEARKFYPDCHPAAGDGGVTEIYWASKGTGVLHHWMYLYASSVNKGPSHAQYGYFVTWCTRAVMKGLCLGGPTYFVRIAWVIFALIGLAYIAVFLHLFRGNTEIAVFLLLLKLLFFLDLGAFPLTLAPGFHWFRELVLLSVGPLFMLVCGVISDQEGGRFSPVVFAGLFSLCLSYLIDPVFFIISAVCALLAFCWINYPAIYSYLKYRKGVFLLVSAFLLLAGVFYVNIQIGNLPYVLDKLLNNNVGLFLLDRRFFSIAMAVCLSAVVFLLSIKGRAHYYLQSYFSFIVLFSVLYFFITPDKFHFLKFLEYCVPFFAVISIPLGNYLGAVLSGKPSIRAKYVDLAKNVIFGGISLALVSCFILKSSAPQLRLISSSHEPYFHSARYTINGRLIEADMSQGLAEHLRAFPAKNNIDVSISPFDKYLTFLYDESNGLASPDLLAWLDSEEKLANTRRSILFGNKPVNVLLDKAVLNVDLREGIKRNNSLLGALEAASKLNLKARLRASVLGEELLQKCAAEGSFDGGQWLMLRCGTPALHPKN